MLVYGCEAWTILEKYERKKVFKNRMVNSTFYLELTFRSLKTLFKFDMAAFPLLILSFVSNSRIP